MPTDEEEKALLTKWDRVQGIADTAAKNMADKLEEDRRIEELTKKLEASTVATERLISAAQVATEKQQKETQARVEEVAALLAKPAASVVDQAVDCINPRCKAPSGARTKLRLPPTTKAGDIVECGRCGAKAKIPA